MIDELIVGHLYSNDDIFRSLKVSNAGGIRVCVEGDAVFRAAILTSTADFHVAGENPYHDRIEDDILTYTAAGKVGEQTLAGMNRRLIEQKEFDFPIHAFVQIASRRNKSVGPQRWKYLGLLEYLRHYPDTQLDSAGEVRKVWLFEFRIHREFGTIPLVLDNRMSGRILTASRQATPGNSPEDDLIADDYAPADGFERIEKIRGKLLALEARKFEFFIKDLLLHCGFSDVCVTKFSADGGVDVNARVGPDVAFREHAGSGAGQTLASLRRTQGNRRTARQPPTFCPRSSRNHQSLFESGHQRSARSRQESDRAGRRIQTFEDRHRRTIPDARVSRRALT
jgi:hypothetical protein